MLGAGELCMNFNIITLIGKINSKDAYSHLESEPLPHTASKI